ncbi:unnamed protein product [Dovyalis caffra]|uniref:Uncharacterized protein n=1 Tax=Dovyalis caffra TaxID=77055 RepID=A0AAV1RV44_9ROSI|nr:unnamed protein product [Dovyalis caffra]
MTNKIPIRRQKITPAMLSRNPSTSQSGEMTNRIKRETAVHKQKVFFVAQTMNSPTLFNALTYQIRRTTKK